MCPKLKEGCGVGRMTVRLLSISISSSLESHYLSISVAGVVAVDVRGLIGAYLLHVRYERRKTIMKQPVSTNIKFAIVVETRCHPRSV